MAYPWTEGEGHPSFKSPPKRERESAVERYFVQQIAKHGGRTKKLRGTKDDPDRLALWPGRIIHFIEFKSKTGRVRPGQAREHKRLRDFGNIVLVLSTKPMVDEYVAAYRRAS